MSEVKESPLTILEFKAWLMGVEEMQEPDWVPSETQWKLIRKRIGKLCDDNINMVLPTQQIPTGPIKRTALQTGSPVVFPEIPTPLVSTVNAQNAAAVQPSTLMVNQQRMVDSVEPTIKTPAIDTSNGVYKSQFD